MTRLSRRHAVSLILAPGALAINARAQAGVRDAAPPRQDAFTGIANRQELKPGDPRTLRKARELRAAMLLSENTKQHIAWCERQTAGLQGIDRAAQAFFGGADAAAASARAHMLAYDPKFVSDNVTRPLVQRFASIGLVNSFDEFKRGGDDVLIVIDVSFVNTFRDTPFFTRYETGTFINAYFLDVAESLVGKVESGETQRVAREQFLFEVAKVRKATLERYEASLTELLGPVPAQADGASAGAGLQPSVVERLKALEELVNRGLVTPEEAAAKRAEILKNL